MKGDISTHSRTVKVAQCGFTFFHQQEVKLLRYVLWCRQIARLFGRFQSLSHYGKERSLFFI